MTGFVFRFVLATYTTIVDLARNALQSSQIYDHDPADALPNAKQPQHHIGRPFTLQPSYGLPNQVELHQCVVDKPALAGHEQIFEYQRHDNPGRNDGKIADHLEKSLSFSYRVNETGKDQAEEHLSRHSDQCVQERVSECNQIILVL